MKQTPTLDAMLDPANWLMSKKGRPYTMAFGPNVTLLNDGDRGWNWCVATRAKGLQCGEGDFGTRDDAVMDVWAEWFVKRGLAHA